MEWMEHDGILIIDETTVLYYTIMLMINLNDYKTGCAN